MNRRELLKPLGIVLVAWPITGQAQQVGKIYRIGFLANDPTIPMQAAGEAFLAGLREHGFVEGKNIVIERRFAQGAPKQSSELAAELTRLDVSLIVASGQNNIAALKGQPSRFLWSWSTSSTRSEWELSIVLHRRAEISPA